MAIAIFSTWTTYGTWLPGDQRGWFLRGRGIQVPDAMRRLEAALIMTESSITLDPGQRRLVEKTIAEHCAIRKWHLHAVNCRSNHVHVVVTADAKPEKVMADFKAYSSRRLKERLGEPADRTRWTQHGSTLYLWTEEEVAAKVEYTVNGQGTPMAVCDSRKESEPEA